MNDGEQQVTNTAPEGAAEATADEVGKMYEELGIKATVPTGKAKGRPKASGVRAKDTEQKSDADSDAGRKASNSKSKSKDAPDSDQNGDSGDEDNPKKSQKRQGDGKVSDESEKAGTGVRKTEPESDEDSESGSKGQSDGTDERDGQDSQQSKDSSQKQDDEEDGGNPEKKGKRPGKSNPEVERRFQKMTTDIREREQRIEELERQLQETVAKQREQQVQQEDPEYTVEDFRKVRDEDGNVVDLEPDQAELYWRRWKDGFEQRKAEREAEYQRQSALEQQEQEYTQRLMQQSAEAYDTLTGIMDEYPELNPGSGSFDQSLSDEIMPLIHETIIYQPGTEPGNEEGVQPVIVGMRMNPKSFLGVINRIRTAKRNLPLNGINDTVESRSNVSVKHSRSSDPTVRAANDLYKELGIDKRL